MQSRRTALWVLLALALLLSTVRFGYEANRIREGGFVDFPIFWARALSFIETGQLYPDSLSSFFPTAPVYKFPPFYMALLVPAARLGLGTEVYVYHWIAQWVLYLGATWLCLVAVGLARSPPYAAVLAILALNFEPFFETLYGLQVETVLLALFAGCLFAVVRRREPMAGLLLSAAAMLKIFPAFLAMYFVLRRRRTALLWVALGGAMTLLYSLAIIGPAEHGEYFGRILPFMMGENPEPIENMGIGRYLQMLGMTAAGAKAWMRWIALIPVALSCHLIYRARDTEDSTLGPAVRFSLLIPLLLLILPNSWPNYQLLLLPAFAVLLALLSEGHPDRRLLIALGAPAYALTLFSGNTPYLLSVITVPEIVASPILEMKALSSLLLWIALIVLLHRDTARANRREAA